MFFHYLATLPLILPTTDRVLSTIPLGEKSRLCPLGEKSRLNNGTSQAGQLIFFLLEKNIQFKGLSVSQTIMINDGIFIFYVTLRIVVYFGQNFLSV